MFIQEKKTSIKHSKDSSIPSHSPNREATEPNPSGITQPILMVAILIVTKYLNRILQSSIFGKDETFFTQAGV